ncbi:hypothetical protein D3C86_786100 [compost metagenome]
MAADCGGCGGAVPGEWRGTCAGRAAQRHRHSGARARNGHHQAAAVAQGDAAVGHHRRQGAHGRAEPAHARRRAAADPGHHRAALSAAHDRLLRTRFQGRLVRTGRRADPAGQHRQPAAGHGDVRARGDIARRGRSVARRGQSVGHRQPRDQAAAAHLRRQRIAGHRQLGPLPRRGRHRRPVEHRGHLARPARGEPRRPGLLLRRGEPALDQHLRRGRARPGTQHRAELWPSAAAHPLDHQHGRCAFLCRRP